MKGLKKFISLLLALVLIFSLAACGNSSAPAGETGSDTQGADWPKKTIQIAVPYNAGGDADIYCRLAAERLGEALGQTVVVVNIAGSGGILAAKQIMNEDPDGYKVEFIQAGTY